ncbi:hypothetical protein ACJX0J_025974 [Zea mays]
MTVPFYIVLQDLIFWKEEEKLERLNYDMLSLILKEQDTNGDQYIDSDSRHSVNAAHEVIHEAYDIVLGIHGLYGSLKQQEDPLLREGRRKLKTYHIEGMLGQHPKLFDMGDRLEICLLDFSVIVSNVWDGVNLKLTFRRVVIVLSADNDQMIWKFGSNGNFLEQSLYSCLFCIGGIGLPPLFLNVVWLLGYGKR